MSIYTFQYIPIASPELQSQTADQLQGSWGQKKRHELVVLTR